MDRVWEFIVSRWGGGGVEGRCTYIYVYLPTATSGVLSSPLISHLKHFFCLPLGGDKSSLRANCLCLSLFQMVTVSGETVWQYTVFWGRISIFCKCRWKWYQSSLQNSTKYIGETSETVFLQARIQDKNGKDGAVLEARVWVCNSSKLIKLFEVCVSSTMKKHWCCPFLSLAATHTTDPKSLRKSYISHAFISVWKGSHEHDLGAHKWMSCNSIYHFKLI